MNTGGDRPRVGLLVDTRVGTVPWRARAAETAPTGRSATTDSFTSAADVGLRAAVPRAQNAFKIPLARRAIVRALGTALNQEQG